MSTPTNLSKNSKISQYKAGLVSVVIPTLNAQNTLSECLDSLHCQTYKNIEVLICDGGSTDQTLALAKKYNCKVLTNQLKTGEAGKSVGIKNATGEYILLLDSDNILPSKNWLSQMLEPLVYNPNIICSEPSFFKYRQKSGFIERYSALIGANDPYAWYSQNLDKINYLSPTPPFTKYVCSETNHYYVLSLTNQTIPLPTIGANGTTFRTEVLKTYLSDYFFDIDFISIYLQKNKIFLCAKTKNSIIHTYCESSIPKFIRKQTRRVLDVYFYKKLRKYKLNNNKAIGFVIYSTLVLPGLIDALRGYIKKPDYAWFFHPPACFLTAYIYTFNSLKNYFGLLNSQNRVGWTQ